MRRARGGRPPSEWVDEWVAVATLVMLGALMPDHRPAIGQTACRITEANASVFADVDQGPVVSYYGQVIMSTKDCGLSPAEVQATFRPVAGTATTCDFRGSLQSDDAVCTQAFGVAATGTQIVVDAVGRTYGTGGAALFASSCTMVVTPPRPGGGLGGSLSRASCPLPVQ